MDLKNVNNNLDQVDNIFTKIKNIFKKHWGIILFALFCYFIYWAWNLPDEPVIEQQTEQTTQQEEYEPTKGDTIWTNDSTYYIYE